MKYRNSKGLQLSWESAAFATQRSRVRIPSGPWNKNFINTEVQLSWDERSPHTREVMGSSPIASTIFKPLILCGLPKKPVKSRVFRFCISQQILVFYRKIPYFRVLCNTKCNMKLLDFTRLPSVFQNAMQHEISLGLRSPWTPIRYVFRPPDC